MISLKINEMYTFKTFLFLTTLCVAKSEVDHETMCKKDYRVVNNNKIDVLEYCSDKLCVDKCCGPNYMLFANGIMCVSTEKVLENNREDPDFIKQYESINILSSWGVNKTPKNFIYVHNIRNSNISYQTNCNTERTDIDKYDVLEDGSLLWQGANKIEKLDKHEYCLDYKLIKLTNNTKGVKIVIKSYVPDQTTYQQIEKFENLSMLISSFFLLLVLVVYSLLPDLRNLTGLVLMAYTLSLLIAFITKLIVVYVPKQTDTTSEPKFCRTLTPVVYFAFVSSIFWLSVYAFDVWWGLRNFRIKRNSQHAKLVKFMWYSLYAWGSALLLTAIVVTLDLHCDSFKLKSLFENCLRKGIELDYYYKIPTGTLIFINIILFCMTVYNIWMVRRAVFKSKDSRSSKDHGNKLATYAKLCLMMGVTWCMELVSEGEKLWQYILLNLCNLFTGLTIFYLFVCKKKVLLQLCQKFHIRNNYIKSLELEFDRNRNKSGISRSTALTSTVRSYDQPQETDILQNSSKGEKNSVV